jgi:hypothetical protein
LYLAEAILVVRAGPDLLSVSTLIARPVTMSIQPHPVDVVVVDVTPNRLLKYLATRSMRWRPDALSAQHLNEHKRDCMRVADTLTESLFSLKKLDDVVPTHHPLRIIRTMVNKPLAEMGDLFAQMYADDIKGGLWVPTCSPRTVSG